MFDLLSILDQRASQNPEKLAYIFLKDRENQEQKITYQQLSQISKRIDSKSNILYDHKFIFFTHTTPSLRKFT